jgi:hypothetical protein
VQADSAERGDAGHGTSRQGTAVIVGSPQASTRFLRARAQAQVLRQLIVEAAPGAREARRRHIRFYHDMWRSAATDLGATVTPMGNGAIEIALGALRLRVAGTHCSVDGPDVLDLAGDKPRVSRMLTGAGLPVPPHRVFSLDALDAALDLVADTPGGCVVKPAQNTGGGRGVTTGIHDTDRLARAVAGAAAAGVRVTKPGHPLRRLPGMLRNLEQVPLLVERQITGDNYRLLFLDGELIDAIRREPPSVIGDGHTDIAGLVSKHNDDRLRSPGHRAQSLVTIDLELTSTLREQGLSLSAVPALGTKVRLKTAVNETAPECNHPARDELCDAVVEQAARAAAVVGARLAGVDVITDDPRRALSDSSGCILEVNTTPGLAMHRHGHPGAVEPAAAILHRLAASTS